MARTDPTDAGCGHTDAAALPAPDARGTHRHEDLYGDAQFLDRRYLLPLIRRTTRAQRHAGALLKHASLQRTHNHTGFALLLFAMPLVYPLFSLALGRTFPMVTTPVMPCSVAVFTIGLMLAFSERINIVLAMFLCHWALIGLSKVYFFGIPEDYLLACSIVPALYIFFREYIRSNEGRPTKPSPRVLNALLVVLCIIIGASFAFTMLHQLNLFTDV